MEINKMEMNKNEANNKSAYKKLLLMQGISFVIMYSVMFMNVASIDHIYLSVTRTYMALLMTLPMAPLMLVFMKDMYKDSKLNTGIITASMGFFVLAFLGLREQWFIRDDQYMKAMIPHHSSAIHTSRKANITNNEVKTLSEEIIESQIEEIIQMEELLTK
jgi:hypothetical protein